MTNYNQQALEHLCLAIENDDLDQVKLYMLEFQPGTFLERVSLI